MGFFLQTVPYYLISMLIATGTVLILRYVIFRKKIFKSTLSWWMLGLLITSIALAVMFVMFFYEWHSMTNAQGEDVLVKSPMSLKSQCIGVMYILCVINIPNAIIMLKRKLTISAEKGKKE